MITLQMFFVHKNVEYGYGAVKMLWHCKVNGKVKVDVILLREIECKKIDILMLLQRFKYKFG